MKKTLLTCAIALTTIFGLSRCADDGGASSSSTYIDNTAVLTSSSLSGFSTLVTATCENDETRCTPENIEGDICYAIYGMGTLGTDFFSGSWLWPEDSEPDDVNESGSCSATTFNLLNSTEFQAQVAIPASADEMPSNKQIIRVELSFNYVDATVSINNGTLNDTYTIRTVYVTSFDADDVSSTMVQGDKLYKASDDTNFQWCNTTTCSETRADVATGIIQDATVTEYTNAGEGNEDYIPVTANFGENGADAVDVTYADLSDTTKTWTLDFDVTDAIVWSEAPSEFDNVRDMLAAFRLKFGPNQSTTQGEDDDGIHASISIE